MFSSIEFSSIEFVYPWILVAKKKKSTNTEPCGSAAVDTDAISYFSVAHRIGQNALIATKGLVSERTILTICLFFIFVYFVFYPCSPGSKCETSCVHVCARRVCMCARASEHLQMRKRPSKCQKRPASSDEVGSTLHAPSQHRLGVWVCRVCRCAGV
jgi:hypothetical protein